MREGRLLAVHLAESTRREYLFQPCSLNDNPSMLSSIVFVLCYTLTVAANKDTLYTRYWCCHCYDDAFARGVLYRKRSSLAWPFLRSFLSACPELNSSVKGHLLHARLRGKWENTGASWRATASVNNFVWTTDARAWVLVHFSSK